MAAVGHEQVCRNDKVGKSMGWLLCLLGVHDYRVVNVTCEFGVDAVEKDQCRRSGATRKCILRSE